MAKRTVAIVRRIVLRAVICLAGMVIMFSALISARAADTNNFSLKESFRNSIEENRKLFGENKKLQEEKEKLQEEVQQNNARITVYVERLKTLTNQIDQLQGKIDAIKQEAEQQKQPLEEKITVLMDEKQGLNSQINELEEKRDSSEYYVKWIQTQEQLQKTQESLDALQLELRFLSSEKESLKERNGKLHYNLGTFYFQKARYQDAAYEFESALNFLASDPDIFYNLAVIYDYYLQDREKAIDYYMKYLQENPDASDENFVKERIVQNDYKAKIFTKQQNSIKDK